MPSIIAEVAGVIERETRRGPVFDVQLSDGQTVATFDVALGSMARSLIGQPARIDVTTKVNGQYTNHYLNSIAPADGSASTPFGDSPAPAYGSADPPASGSSMTSQTLADPVAERIARTSALRMAVDEAIAANQPGVVALASVDRYVAFILRGERWYGT